MKFSFLLILNVFCFLLPVFIPKINSLGDNEKEVTFSTLNHLITSSKEVAVIEEASHVSMYKVWFEGNVNYYCCGKDMKSQKDIHCRQPIKSNGWQDAFYVVLNALTIFMVFYCAAFPLLLPDFLFNLKEDLEKENRQEQQGNHEYESLD